VVSILYVIGIAAFWGLLVVVVRRRSPGEV